ncbi:MAG: HTH-type transcriptional activator IlvY [Gammaproteobacteria bacterium]|nr:MAG: HTH-type transcriptional activator IlvY [Gammaproteobacteria bacterium]
MDIRALRLFLIVADTLSFTRASEQAHISVSAVSRSIGRLEAELGHRLLERDRRSVRLTAEGSVFRNYARGAVADWRQLQTELGGETALAGEVSLYCSVTASYSVLAPILESFRLTHPEVDIMLHTGDQADGVSRVLEGHDDLAVSGRPKDLPWRLDFLPLLESPLVFVMPTADCLVRDAVLRVDELGHPDVSFIVPERGVTKDLLDDWFTKQRATPTIYAQVAGHEAIVAMVALGLGVGLAPQLVVEASGLAAQVEIVPVAEPPPPLSIGLCAQNKRLSQPLVRSLWDVAASTYRIASR